MDFGMFMQFERRDGLGQVDAFNEGFQLRGLPAARASSCEGFQLVKGDLGLDSVVAP